MAAGGRPPCDAQLLCSICLDVFRQPVSTPCGHNYCQACITQHWDSGGLADCPLCKKVFPSRPQLQVNTGFRDMVEHFNGLGVGGAEGTPVMPGEVACDVCPGPKLKALKTCLVCLASYCERHLEPHLRAASLKKHELAEPASNLEDRVCEKHGRMLELFCQPDQACICCMCLTDGHVAHEAVPLERAHAAKKTELLNAMSRVKAAEEAQSNTVREVKDSIQRSQIESGSDTSTINALLSVLEDSLTRRREELMQMIRDKHQAAVTEARGFVAQREQELAEMRRRRSDMERLLQANDHLHLLRTWPSLQLPEHVGEMLGPIVRPPPDKGPRVYAGIVKKAVDRMEKALGNEMELLFREVGLSDSCEVPKQEGASDGFLEDMLKPEDRMLMIQHFYATGVEMDKDAISHKVVVSEDGKWLACLEDIYLDLGVLPHDPATPNVVFATQGKFNFEVQVWGADDGCLGVSRPLVLNNERWILASDMSSYLLYSVIDGSQSRHSFQIKKPETIRVFVDYDKGEVSFCDVNARTLVYSISKCNFTRASMRSSPLNPVDGGGVNQPQYLYPAYSICGHRGSGPITTPAAP